MNNGKFYEFSIALKEISTLPRQSMCMQALLLMRYCESNPKNMTVTSFRHNDAPYFENQSIRQNLLSCPDEGNLSRSLRALYEAGFVDRVAVNENTGELNFDIDFRSKSSKIYWGLTDKSRLVLF